MIRSLIFDCDGVLVDTEPVGNAVLAALLTEHGLQTSLDECMRDYRGRSMTSCVALAEKRLGHALPPDFAERYYAGIRAGFERRLEPVTGVVQALDRIDLPSCVASSGPHHKMRLTLGRTGLWARFEGRIFSAGEVQRGKPAPDLFMHAARSMGFDARATAVVEDSVPGVQAGRAAGMRVLAYAGAADSDPDALAAAGGEVFADMAQLPDLLEDER